MKTVLFLITCLVFYLLPFSGSAADLESKTAGDIIAESYRTSKTSGSESITTLTIIDRKGRERVRKISSASKTYENGTEKRIVKFLFPADVKGTGMLIFDYEEKDDDMWIYMPALRKTRRIVSKEKSKSFMGSEFSNADISTPALDDFTYKKLGEETVDGVVCLKIELVPADEKRADDYGYSKKELFVGVDDFVARKAVFYDLNGELLKVLLARNIMALDEANGKFQAREIVISNVQNDRRSVMVFEKLINNPDVKEEYFTVRYLEKN